MHQHHHTLTLTMSLTWKRDKLFLKVQVTPEFRKRTLVQHSSRQRRAGCRPADRPKLGEKYPVNRERLRHLERLDRLERLPESGCGFEPERSAGRLPLVPATRTWDARTASEARVRRWWNRCSESRMHSGFGCRTKSKKRRRHWQSSKQIIRFLYWNFFLIF